MVKSLDKKFFQSYTFCVKDSTQETARRGRGRPRQYPEGPADGAPQISVRLTPEMVSWVKERGGASYVRSLVAADQHAAQSLAKACSHCGDVIEVGEDQVEVRIKSKDPDYFHLDCALPLLGKGARSEDKPKRTSHDEPAARSRGRAK